MASSPENVQDPFIDLVHYNLVGSSNQKKSWEELRGAIKRSKLNGMKIINRVPHNFTFKHTQTQNGHKTRLYFLGVPMGSRENTLLYVDILPSSDGQESLKWGLLLDSFSAIPRQGQFSKEEQLLRERKRLGSFGITSYDYDMESGQFVFPACNSLFSCCDSTLNEIYSDHLDSTSQNGQVFPTELKTSQTGTRLDPKINPSNPNLLGYICNNDVWVTNCETGRELKLTHADNGKSSLAENQLSAGVPSFVVQEEFDRYTGYWWQPNVEKSPDPIYRILYEEVDESDVEILNLSSVDCKGTDEFRYPRAGTPNAKCVLKMLEFRLDENGDVVNIVHKQLIQSLTQQFPWIEYILRAGWTPDGRYVYAQVLDRYQRRLALILIPYESFNIPCDLEVAIDMDDETAEQKQGMGEPEGYEVPSPLVLSPSPNGEMDTVIESELPLHVIYEDKSDIWINVHDIIHFFPQTTPSEISFIWASEKSGFRHLYHVTSSLQKSSYSHENPASGLGYSHGACSSSVIKELPLTSGNWEVCIKQVWVDEEKKLVYFTALKDNPLETHLYVVSYENPGAIVRLTELGYSHIVSMDKECSLFVTVYSSINKPPASTIYQLHHSNGKIEPVPVGCLLKQEALSDDFHPPELFDYESSSGHRMYGMLYKPHNFQTGKKYPTVNYVYGGPQVQLVSNSYKGMRLVRLHTLASLGYVVVVIDTRGSSQRGLQFESHIKDRLGTVEIADQVEGLNWLADKYDWIDLSRVAIHGWSYGGYLSLMGLAQRPDVYRVAVAGAPVTSWLLYDTGYTERYLGLPDENREGYKQGSVLEYVSRIPSEENRLMIVHGLIDENVHFFHTCVLINALIKECKPYHLQVYPNERHGIRNQDASEHNEAMVLSFLQQNLMFASRNDEDTYL